MTILWLIQWFMELILFIYSGCLFGYILGMFMHSECVFNKNPLKRLVALVFMMLYSVMICGKFAGFFDSLIAAMEAAQ